MGEQEKPLPHQGPGHGLGKAQGAPLGRGAVPVVVAQHQHLFPGQLGEDAPVLLLPPGGKIPQVEHGVPRPHLLVPAADELPVHLLHCGEGPVLIAQDVPVPKVGVGKEKHAHSSMTSAAWAICWERVSPPYSCRHSL